MKAKANTSPELAGQAGMRDYRKEFVQEMGEDTVNIKCRHCKQWFDFEPDECRHSVTCPFCDKQMAIADSVHPARLTYEADFRVKVVDDE